MYIHTCPELNSERYFETKNKWKVINFYMQRLNGANSDLFYEKTYFYTKTLV